MVLRYTSGPSGDHDGVALTPPAIHNGPFSRQSSQSLLEPCAVAEAYGACSQRLPPFNIGEEWGSGVGCDTLVAVLLSVGSDVHEVARSVAPHPPTPLQYRHILPQHQMYTYLVIDGQKCKPTEGASLLTWRSQMRMPLVM